MFRTIEIMTVQGPLNVREWGARGADTVVLMVGGVGGGFDSPADNLYSRLGDALPSEGLSAMQVQYRNPRALEGCVTDVLEGIRFLRNHGSQRVVLIGHSMGGAVVVNAALRSSEVVAVLAISTQMGGMNDPAGLVRPVLFLHGTHDEILPAACSVSAWRMAREPRRLELIDGGSHTLDESANEVHLLARRWLMEQVRPDAVASK